MGTDREQEPVNLKQSWNLLPIHRAQEATDECWRLVAQLGLTNAERASILASLAQADMLRALYLLLYERLPQAGLLLRQDLSEMAENLRKILKQHAPPG